MHGASVVQRSSCHPPCTYKKGLWTGAGAHCWLSRCWLSLMAVCASLMWISWLNVLSLQSKWKTWRQRIYTFWKCNTFITIYYKKNKKLYLCVQHKAEPVVRPNNDQKSCTEKYILRTFSHTSGSFYLGNELANAAPSIVLQKVVLFSAHKLGSGRRIHSWVQINTILLLLLHIKGHDLWNSKQILSLAHSSNWGCILQYKKYIYIKHPQTCSCLRSWVWLAFRSSVSGRFADFVVNLGEGVLTAQFLPQSVIQPPVKHLPKLLSLHVHVGIEHLETAGGHRSQHQCT